VLLDHDASVLITRQEVSRVPLVDMRAVHEPVVGLLTDAFHRVLRSGAFLGGEEVERFETELAAYVGTSHAVAVGSGTAALQLLLAAAGIGAGDEVLIPPNTFFATAEAVVATGARPVLVDVDPGTGLMDPAEVSAAVGPRTAAVVPVHLHGQPADTRALRRLAQRHGLLLVEDDAQAIGAADAGRSVGTLGDGAAFSFYPGKNLGALGDAGAVTTDDAALADAVRSLRSHGERERHQHVAFGHTHRMDALQAAFLRVKLAQLPEAQASRDAAVELYDRHLDALPSARRLTRRPGVRHVHHHLVVRVDRRDDVLRTLHRQGVMAAVHYPTPLHRQPAWPVTEALGAYPQAESLTSSILSMPLFAGMSPTQVDVCAGALREALRETGAHLRETS
jgi:dTDP-4-amino-4,6-dideoxygalactose transaminase